MRFRAVVSSPATFLQIVQSVSKLSHRCILHLALETAHVVCCDETEGGVQVWSQIHKASLFSSYRIESNQPESSIHLSLAVGPLLTVLKSAVANQGKGEVVLKLAKRAQAEGQAPRPMLVWEIGGDSALNRAPPLAHELPIRVLKPAEVALLREPLCPDPDIHILLPPLALLRTITSHLAPLSARVTVAASADGTFALRAGAGEGRGVEVGVEWKGLKVPKVGNDPSQDAAGEADEEAAPAGRPFQTTVALKSILRFLAAHAIVGSTIACICEGHSLILYLYIGEVDRAGGVLTFFIPAVGGDDDD